MEPSSNESERNRAVVLVSIERGNRGDWKEAVQYFAADTRNFGKPAGREGVLAVLEDVHRTFPDWTMEVLDSAAEGDSVVVRLRVSGTHRGVARLPVNGGMLVGVEPTGKQFEVLHIHWFKLRGGEIVDHYAARDDLGMMVQLGLLTRGGR